MKALSTQAAFSILTLKSFIFPSMFISLSFSSILDNKCSVVLWILAATIDKQRKYLTTEIVRKWLDIGHNFILWISYRTQTYNWANKQFEVIHKKTNEKKEYCRAFNEAIVIMLTLIYRHKMDKDVADIKLINLV